MLFVREFMVVEARELAASRYIMAQFKDARTVEYREEINAQIDSESDVDSVEELTDEDVTELQSEYERYLADMQRRAAAQ